jgi:hypothetical protein
MKLKTLALGLLAFASACTGYNSIDVKDKNADSELVYGDKGGPARQLKNTYEADPASAERANKIREKLFGESTVILQEGATPGEAPASAPAPAADTTAVKVNA